ncbi:hypothetical protein OPT61_g863 [Boeremia exigua]|uniref:Uncharacterized protein n=1 Tax=Boeremia exigua TaxID=749465 RepID=A0ACC2ISE2_9PLEO|nr:hypothetical protein OPT61_g863 [Boeremia exigua]
MSWEGHLLNYLEQQDVPVVRSEEGVPCDGALLCQPTATEAYARTLHAIKHDPQVIPPDIQAAHMFLDRTGCVLAGRLNTHGLTLGRPLQRELVQLFIVFLQNSQEVLFLPKNFTDMPRSAERRIQACANNETLPYVNPSNGVTFPAGLFETKPASLVLSTTPNLTKTAEEVKGEQHYKRLALPLHEAHQYLLPPGVSTTKKSFDSEDRQYIQLQEACAHIGQGLIEPYERPCVRSFGETSSITKYRRCVATYCYVEYQWTSDEVRDFFELNKLPLKASRLTPTTIVLPLALARLGNRTHLLNAANRTLRALAHPRKDVVLWYMPASLPTADHATLEGAAEDQMLLVPSDHIKTDEEDLMSLKSQHKEKGCKGLDDILSHPSIHFRCPFKEVAINLAKFFDDPFGEKPDFYVRDERLAVRKEEYLCFWKDLLQDQVDGLWKAHGGTKNSESLEDDDLFEDDDDDDDDDQV